MRLAAVLFLILLLIPAGAIAGPLEDGKAAYTRQDFQTALKLLQPLAEQGDAKAQLLLGRMYDRGDGVKQNYTEAFKWYRKAADQGNLYAQEFVGAMYTKGWGVRQDETEALKWLRKPADQLGDPWAMLTIGFIYQSGLSSPKNPVEAYYWYSRAKKSIVGFKQRWNDEAESALEAAAKLLTSEELVAVQKRVAEWKQPPAPAEGTNKPEAK